MKKTVHSPIALGIIVLVTLALLSWLLITQQSAVTETADVGGQGLKKAAEIKLELEDPNGFQQAPADQAKP